MRTLLSKLRRTPLVGPTFTWLKSKLKGARNQHLARAFLLARSAERRRSSGTIAFRSLEDLVLASQSLAERVPNNYDLIVGVPRSGLLPANLLASKFGRPLTAAGLPPSVPPWVSEFAGRKPSAPLRILVLDDSATTASSVLRAKEEFQMRHPTASINTAVLYATPESAALVDFFHEMIPHPRIFEWNLMHAKQGILATDMDGVLCENCPPGTSDNEETYCAWLKTAKPHLIPSFHIEYIVTNRFERHRDATEAWLNQHGVDYGTLLMSPASTKAEAHGTQIKHKVERLCAIKPDVFWESAKWEAENVWRQTHIPTLCTDEMIFFA